MSSSLLLTSECCRLLLYLSYTLPSLSLPEWPLELNEAVSDDVMTLEPVPAGWLQSECELQPLAQYLIVSLYWFSLAYRVFFKGWCREKVPQDNISNNVNNKICLLHYKALLLFNQYFMVANTVY